ncbi:hypothetical protein E2C01_023660 [Portunus trituberculatus]|uniref:Uncharacterized protein n=1 Tax=Portunus trituberculatus TaxID=210409 RepID=A0A5B7EAK4_PORTR|nr:hypothetical protein [Portunus trituberculatus]
MERSPHFMLSGTWPMTTVLSYLFTTLQKPLLDPRQESMRTPQHGRLTSTTSTTSTTASSVFMVVDGLTWASL